MRDLSILFLLILIMTNTSDASPDGEKHDDKSSPKITDVDHHSFVKCKYLSKVITLMKDEPLDELTNWSRLIDGILDYNVNKSITSLYKRDASLIGSLWDFYLYKHWLDKADMHLLTVVAKNTIKQTKVMTTHGNVIRSLETDLRMTDRLKDHKNSRYDKWIKPTAAHIKSMVKVNRFAHFGHVNLNDALQPETLFVRALATREAQLMYFHFRNIKWAGTSQTLHRSWENIWLDFDVTAEHYEKIKSYFKLNNDFLNIIVIIMSWSHLLCIEQISDEKQKLSYSTQLITLLNVYKQNMLIIQDDANLNYLLEATEEMANKNGDIIKTTSQLKAIVELMCSLLGCSVEDVTLTISETETVNKLNADKEIDLSNCQPGGIDPLRNVKDFLDIVRDIFKGVHLDITRTLLSHVDHMLSASGGQIKQN
ncbi:uncharacterized protein LOC126843098 isoform X5 [Adelges cooleyi]|uniref:uncharacterized protein LOC126843098 isoform X5 n=1 Tax=Adelges cooleyi TaxID=133065 RepID=UPI002180305E|nr:uncharacterized protein LOC126843098 isoform X5 [Adelges cooleyi]